MKTLTGKKTSYTEIVGGKGPFLSPVFSFGIDRSRCNRVVEIIWDNLWQASLDFLGWPSVVTGGAKYIKREIPDGITAVGSAIPPKTYLWCTEITEARPLGLPDNVGTPDMLIESGGTDPIARGLRGRLSLQYNTLTYEVLSDKEMRSNGDTTSGEPDESTLTRYVTKRVKPSAKYVGFPRGVLKFVTGNLAGKPIEGQPGLILPSATVELTWHHIPYDGVPSSYYNPGVAAGAGNIDARVGRVNQGTFAGFTAGTLLLTAAEAVPHVSAHGDRLFDITYFFLHDPNKHNWTLGLSGGNKAFIELSVDGVAYADTAANAGKHIYDAQTMEELFRPQ